MQIKAQFKQDPPWPHSTPSATDLLQGRIPGCSAVELEVHADSRGHLIELLTTRDSHIDPMVHVYQVFAEPKSVRAWIYHAIQTDRLCLTDGSFRIVLFDLRKDSPAAGKVIELHAGERRPTLLTIPPFVVHGVQNLGDSRSCYVNLPNRVYDLQNPDKYRVPYDSPLIDFQW